MNRGRGRQHDWGQVMSFAFCCRNLGASQRRQVAKPLAYYQERYGDRDTAIIKAYERGAYGMKEIGDRFRLHYSRVSRIVNAKKKQDLNL